MRASSDLKQFSGLLYPRMLDEHPDLREALADLFQSQSKRQNERLRKTLDHLLSGAISDNELQTI